MTTKPKDYFNAICKVTRAFGSTLNNEELLKLIVESAVETMDGKAAALFLEDDGADFFKAVAQTGLSEAYLHPEPHQIEKNVQEILKGEHIAIKDATTDSRVVNHDLKKAEGIASILVVPVYVQGRIIGSLCLYTSVQRDFSEDDIDFLAALAEQGGMAVRNAELFDRIKKNSKMFLDIASNLNSSLDIKHVLHILTAEIAEAFDMKGVNIRLLNKDKGTLEAVASYGISEEFLEKGPVSADKSVTAALGGETVLIEDARTDKRIQYKDAMKKEGIVSMASVPIKVRDEVIGVMRLYSGAKREFSEDTLMFVNAVSNQGGLAINNASMYLMLQEDKKSLEEEIWSHKQWF